MESLQATSVCIGVGPQNKTLQHFFAELRKQNGSEYEPESLRTMLSSLDRFLHDKGKQYSILKDQEFESCRKVLNGKAIELREMAWVREKTEQMH